MADVAFRINLAGCSCSWAKQYLGLLGGLSRALIPVCWGLLGFALFRFWPLPGAIEAAKQASEIGLEPIA